ncbi:MAG TPA: hypothetical protein VE175_14095 [Woeseiaceae bacterium]|nr:hypothetical protein [Woeseiaceae bacterium]
MKRRLLTGALIAFAVGGVALAAVWCGPYLSRLGVGSKEQIDKVVKEYRIYYEMVSAESYYGKSSQRQPSAPLGNNYIVGHSGNTCLMPPEGEYLIHFAYGTKPQEMAETLRKTITTLGSPPS